MPSVGGGTLLAHEHAGLHSTGTADDTSNSAIVGARAGNELTGILRINADNHSRLCFAIESRNVELLGEVAAAGDLEFLRNDTTIAASEIVGVELNRGSPIGF